MAESGKPTVRMTEDEAWDFVAQSVNGTLTTLRRDGRPVALPIWFVVLDRRVYIQTRGKKLLRVQHDPRASFLVEDGERWVELRAVHLDCEARVIEPEPDLAERIDRAHSHKYEQYRAVGEAMPDASRAHYAAAAGGTIELIPQGKILTWDNGKLTRTKP
jgi:nitroimidazol reductase NimA-like FMN-containing flavoprotein (pyridoxamine 5'-phosphate oxidase superfamily)